MKYLRGLAIAIALMLFPAYSQAPGGYTPETAGPRDIRLPNGKLQRDELVKYDHEKSLKDAATLLKEAEDLKAELEKNDKYVVSISTLKKLDNIEKLAKQIRGRLKRY